MNKKLLTTAVIGSAMMFFAAGCSNPQAMPRSDMTYPPSMGKMDGSYTRMANHCCAAVRRYGCHAMNMDVCKRMKCHCNGPLAPGCSQMLKKCGMRMHCCAKAHNHR